MNPTILHVFIGNKVECNISINNDETKGIYFVDNDLLKENKLDSEKSLINVDFNDYEAVEGVLENIKDIKSIVIYPLIDINQNYDSLLLNIEDLLRKLVIFSKGVYIAAMNNRKVKVWFIDSTMPMDNCENHGLLESFSTGVNAISKVIGMELAKKKTVVNYIKVDDKDNFNDVSQFIEWTLDRAIYLDMQNLIV